MATVFRLLQTNRQLLISVALHFHKSKFHPRMTSLNHKFHTDNTLRGRDFFIDAEALEFVKEQADATPFPVRYLEFTTCQDLYATLNMVGLEKPLSGVKFNAAYIDTQPHAKPTTPVVVCLHGAPGGHWDFNDLIIHLADKGIRVIAINFPGYGWTKMDEGKHFENSSEEKACFLRDFLYCLGIEKVHMGVAHSAGVYPALILTSEDKHIFQSLAMINPGGLGEHRVLKPYSYLRFHARFYRNPILRPFLLLILKTALVATGFGNKNAFQMSVAVETLASVPYDEYKAYPASMAIRQMPSVLIHSVNDRAVEAELSYEFAKLLAGGSEVFKSLYDKNGKRTTTEVDPNAHFMQHHVFASGGHFLNKRYPETINEIIDKFFHHIIAQKKY